MITRRLLRYESLLNFYAFDLQAKKHLLINTSHKNLEAQGRGIFFQSDGLSSVEFLFEIQRCLSIHT